MFKNKVSIPVVVLSNILGIAATYLVFSFLEKNQPSEVEKPEANKAVSCKPGLVRLNGYEFIRPVLFKSDECEGESLLPVKSEILNLIAQYKSSGIISSASVYLRQLNQGEYISVNESEKFNPGSLLKVPELITFMKMHEKNPAILDKKIPYPVALDLKKRAFFVSNSIVPGNTYTIRELLYYMIAYSDNNATMLLNKEMDLAVFKKVYTDLGLADPDMTKNDLPITVKEYSLFLRVLYNATYLNIEDSEYCTELLTHSDFNKGLLNGLPTGIKAAHKFGEANDGVNAHLGESAIIYLANRHYLLTVMTKGKELTILPSVISDISKKVYEMIDKS